MELLYTAHLPPGDGPHPTIIALHGWGATAHDLFGLAPVLHGGRAIVLCPQGNVSVELGPQVPPGYGWFPATGGGELDPAALAKAYEGLSAFLDAALERYPVDLERVVLMGFSQGGVMAYGLALGQPGRYAGLIAMSSWLPESLAGDVRVDQAGALAELPVLVTHGSDDPAVPIERAYESRDRLLALGVSPSFREYPMEHEIRPEVLRDVVAWLEEKVFSPIQRI